MNTLLSVVIPVYKVELYLDRCVSSVLRQDCVGEVILVDDGSPDNCPSMCDAWAEKDKRIRVIHKENGGLSDARNKGIEIAAYEYISLVDSDDELSNGTLQEALTFAIEHDCDIVEFPILTNAGSDREHKISFCNNVHDISSADAICSLWQQSNMQNHAFAHNKIYRKRLFQYISYPVGRNYEDLWTLPSLLEQAQRYGTISKGCYIYYFNPEGICSSYKYENKRLEAIIKAFNVLGMKPTDSKAADMLMDIMNCQTSVLLTNRTLNNEAIRIISNTPMRAARNYKESLKLGFYKFIGLFFRTMTRQK